LDAYVLNGYNGGPFAFNGTETASSQVFVFDFTDLINREFLDGAIARKWYLHSVDSVSNNPLTIEAYKIIDVQGGTIVTQADGVPQSIDNSESIIPISYQLQSGTVNYPPMVSAGPDISQNYPHLSANLTGQVKDDGLPQGSVVSVYWSQVSGPDSLTIQGADTLTPAIIAPKPGKYIVRLTATDGALSTSDEMIADFSAYTVIYSENFENLTGWSFNPDNQDTASAGYWECSQPERTEWAGTTFQSEYTNSGSKCLITGALAGSDYSANDLDNGFTRVRSPWVELPEYHQLTLQFYYYLTHNRTATADDYLKVRILTQSNGIFEETIAYGQPYDIGAGWNLGQISLQNYAGQTVAFEFEAADLADDNILEAAIDDFEINGVFTIPCDPPCSAPINLTIANLQGNRVDISWDEVPGATLYDVEYYQWGSWTLWQETPYPYTPLFNLNSMQTYQVRIKAHCGNDCFSVYSQPIEFTTPCDCQYPSSIYGQYLSPNSADIVWESVPGAYAYAFRYLDVTAAGSWTEPQTISATSVILENLTAGHVYQFRISSFCKDGCNSEESAPIEFQLPLSSDCLPPANLSVSDITNTTANLWWTPVSGAAEYTLRYRSLNSPDWNYFLYLTDAPFSLYEKPEVGPDFEFQVRTHCSKEVVSVFSESYFFTLGQTYGPSAGEDDSMEWIARVKVGSFVNNSGNNGGYTDFTDKVIPMHQDMDYALELTPGYSGTLYPEYFRVWIDLNHNYDFGDDEELIFDPGYTVNQTVYGTLRLPADLYVGRTRMRIAMKYVNPNSSNPDNQYPPKYRDIFPFGEVEDYTVEILPPPVPPVADFTYTVSNRIVYFTDASNSSNGSIVKWNWSYGDNYMSTLQNPAHLYPQHYSYYVTLTVTDNLGLTAKTTKLVSTAYAPQYTPSAGQDCSYFWISKVCAETLNNVSGAATYTDFTQLITPLKKGNSQTVTFTPAYANYTYPVYFRVWIDFNRDGDFNDSGELVFNPGYTVNGQISGTISLPSSAVSGQTRMRVSMKYISSGSSNPANWYAQTPSEIFPYGEVEDYTIHLY
jgi:PKD repeat protein